MAVQGEPTAAQQGQRPPLFSKFGFNIYRKDVEDALTGAVSHPWVTVALVAVATSVAIFFLAFAGGIKPNSLVYIILGIPMVGFSLLVFVLVLDMKVKTILPICLLLAVALFMVDPRGSDWWTQNYTPPPPQPEQQNQPQQSPNVHSEYETVAQSVCTNMAIKGGVGGWTFAVQRQCDAVTIPCTKLCGLQSLHDLDSPTKNKRWSCLGALHVYPGRTSSDPSTASKPSLGFKVYWDSVYHEGQNCGPNYCCCHAS